MTLAIGDRVGKLARTVVVDSDGKAQTVFPDESALVTGEMAREFEVEWISGYGGRQLVMLREVK